MTNQALQTKDGWPLYLVCTHAAATPTPPHPGSFYSLAKYTHTFFLFPFLSPLSQDRSLMAYTDSNVTARLTVDILSSLKTCPAPLFSLALLRLPDYCQRYSTGGVEGQRQEEEGGRDSSFHSLLIV